MKPPQNDQPRTLTADPELAAMSRISKALNSLPDDARQRAVAWLLAKYGPKETVKE